MKTNSTTETALQQHRKTGAAVAVASAMIEHMTRELNDPAIGANQINLLLQLYIHGTIQQVELKNFTGVDRSANSRNIAKLGQGEKPNVKPGPGLVDTERDINNRKHQLVFLSQKGRLFVEAAAQKAARLFPAT